MKKAAETSDDSVIATSPRLFSSAPPTPAPTLSTSAAATPSGYGRSLPVTSARRSGTEYITPNMPPKPITATDCQ